MPKITKVLAITPVFKEPVDMIQVFDIKMELVQNALRERGVELLRFYLCDGGTSVENTSRMESPIPLISHEQNVGLAHTLVDGYKEAIRVYQADLIIIRLDVQEHDPWKILEIVDVMEHTDAEALFLPVYYWVEGQLRPSMREVQSRINDFSNSLAPINQLDVLSTYNQIFPLGYQAFRSDLLQKLVPMLEEGLVLCREITGKPATWGLDLLVILLAARMGVKIDSFFGGWSTPWLENRTAEHIANQREKARVMVEVAKALGCPVK